MSNLIGLINYGVSGNIHSIKKSVEKANGEVLVINKPEELSKVDKIIVPGVGSFADALLELKNAGFVEPLKNEIKTKPTLGICLGMQILSSIGFEYGKTRGLELINGEVKLMYVDAKVPHMGFNSLIEVKDNDVLKNLSSEEFYFMHSYELVNYTDVTTLTDYAGHNFVSSIQKDNIFGV